MSTTDLFVPDFPHGTRDGYQRGCHGSACPNQNTENMTCRQADVRMKSDYRYAKHIRAGGVWLSKDEIPASDAPKPVARPKPAVDTSNLAAIQEALDADDEPEAVSAEAAHTDVAAAEPEEAEEPRKKPGKKRLDPSDPGYPHGTANGYNRGCHDGDTCPGHPDTGVSCPEARRTYQESRRRANGIPPRTSRPATAAVETGRPRADIAGLLEDLSRARAELEEMTSERERLAVDLRDARAELVEAGNRLVGEQANLAEVTRMRDHFVDEHQRLAEKCNSLSDANETLRQSMHDAAFDEIVLEVGVRRVTISGRGVPA